MRWGARHRVRPHLRPKPRAASATAMCGGVHRRQGPRALQLRRERKQRRRPRALRARRPPTLAERERVRDEPRAVRGLGRSVSQLVRGGSAPRRGRRRPGGGRAPSDAPSRRATLEFCRKAAGSTANAARTIAPRGPRCTCTRSSASRSSASPAESSWVTRKASDSARGVPCRRCSAPRNQAGAGPSNTQRLSTSRAVRCARTQLPRRRVRFCCTL